MSLWRSDLDWAIKLIIKNGLSTWEDHHDQHRWRLMRWGHRALPPYRQTTQWHMVWRDPWQRWLSGITEFVLQEGWSRCKLHRVQQDGHTITQWHHTWPMQPRLPTRVWMLEDDGINRLNQWCEVTTHPVPRENATIDSAPKQKILDELMNRITPQLRDAVIQYYQVDYALMDWYYSDRQVPGFVRAEE